MECVFTDRNTATVPWRCWITWHFFKCPKKEDVLCKSFFRESTEVQIKNMYWATFSSLRTTKQWHNFVFCVQLFKCSVTILCHVFCLYIPVRICFSLNLWCFHVSEFISTTKAEHFPHHEEGSILGVLVPITPLLHSFSSSSFVRTLVCFVSPPTPMEWCWWKWVSIAPWSGLKVLSVLSRKLGHPGLYFSCVLEVHRADSAEFLGDNSRRSTFVFPAQTLNGGCSELLGQCSWVGHLELGHWGIAHFQLSSRPQSCKVPILYFYLCSLVLLLWT